MLYLTQARCVRFHIITPSFHLIVGRCALHTSYCLVTFYNSKPAFLVFLELTLLLHLSSYILSISIDNNSVLAMKMESSNLALVLGLTMFCY